VRRVAADQVVGLALERGGDRLQYRPGVRSPASLDLIELAAVDADGFCQLRLGQPTMSAPFTQVVLWKRMMSIHVLQSPNR